MPRYLVDMIAGVSLYWAKKTRLTCARPVADQGMGSVSTVLTANLVGVSVRALGRVDFLEVVLQNRLQHYLPKNNQKLGNNGRFTVHMNFWIFLKASEP